MEEGAKSSMGVDCQRMRTMLRVRSSPIIVSPTEMVPVVGLVLLSRPTLFISYYCRCVSAYAINIVVTLGEVGLKEGYGGGLVIVTSKSTVV